MPCHVASCVVRQVPEPLARALGHAVEALDGLRTRSAWHWVDLGVLFGCLEAGGGVTGGAAGRKQEAGGSGSATPRGVSIKRAAVA